MSEQAKIGHYRIIQKLGAGGYGEIFSVRDPNSSSLLALKTETLDSAHRSLQSEIRFLKMLPSEPCFPRVIAEGQTSAVNYFVMPLYGPSVGAIRCSTEGRHFSMPTICRLGYVMLEIIEKLHAVGVVHCDIKPDNFLLNQLSVGGFVLIDYGLSTVWQKNGEHVENRTTEGFRGTLRYGSVHMHRMSEPSRRDDVISWFYSLVEMAKGKLPWKDVLDHHLAMSCKQTITTEKLCGALPRQFQVIWNYIKDLGFDQEPDYALIRNELEKVFEENGWGMCCRFDWEENPEVLYKLTPFPELFDKHLMEVRARASGPKRRRRKSKCPVQ
jgi:serine/threonine protein kinase